MTNSLPPQTPHEPDDLLPGEAELRALYGKLPQNEPSPALDAAVLRAAAEALSSERAVTTARIPATSKSRNRAPRWLIGLSSAATLVLAAGLAWHMRSMPQADTLPVPTEAISAKALSDSAAGSAPASAPAAMLAPAAIPPPPPMPPKQSPPQRIIQATRSQRAMEAVSERAKNQAARKQVQAAMPRPSAVATSALGEVAPAPAAPQGRAADDKAAAQPPRVPPEVMSMPTIQPPIPALEHSPPAPSASPAPPAPSAPAQEATAVEVAVNANESDMQTVSAAQKDELEAIRKLFVEHQGEEAQLRLEAFHQQYPQQSLPPDLQARLRKP